MLRFFCKPYLLCLLLALSSFAFAQEAPVADSVKRKPRTPAEKVLKKFKLESLAEIDSLSDKKREKVLKTLRDLEQNKQKKLSKKTKKSNKKQAKKDAKQKKKQAKLAAKEKRAQAIEALVSDSVSIRKARKQVDARLKTEKKAQKKKKRAAKRKERRDALLAPRPIETYTSNGRKYNVTGVSVGPELGYYVFPLINPKMLVRTYYEGHVNAQINNKFFLNADYGYFNMSRSLGFVSFYDSEGSYARFGLDYNMLHKRTDEDAIFFGFRYAFSAFSHEVAYRGLPDYWYNTRPEFLRDENLQAQWLELTAGIRVRLVGNLYFNFTTRLQVLTQTPQNTTFNVVDIPGHGFTDPLSSSKFNLGYHLTYRFRLWR